MIKRGTGRHKHKQEVPRVGKVSVRGTEQHLRRRNGKKKKTTGKRKEDEDRERRERKEKMRESQW